MAQSLTQQVNGCSPVQRMAGVTMAQPVGASFLRNSSAFSSFLDQVSNRNPVQAATVNCFATPKNRRANSLHPLCYSKSPDTDSQEVKLREFCHPCRKSRVAHFHR